MTIIPSARIGKAPAPQRRMGDRRPALAWLIAALLASSSALAKHAPAPAAPEAPRAPTVAALARQIDQLAERYDIRPRRLARLRSGLKDPSDESRLHLAKAIATERATQQMRTHFDSYAASAYVASEAAQHRTDKSKNAPTEPKNPDARGVFAPEHWAALGARARASALGLVAEDGQLRR